MENEKKQHSKYQIGILKVKNLHLKMQVLG